MSYDSAAEDQAPDAIPIAVRLQLEAARRLGIDGRIVDPEYGYLYTLSRNGRTIPMIGGRSALNSAVAARLAEDKHYTALLLAEAGCRVPETVRCLKPGHFSRDKYASREGVEAGLAFAERRGYPLVVKPNRLSHARRISVVHSREELLAAVDRVWERDYIALIQEYIRGLDVRLNFLDGEFLVGYERYPVEIAGDGTSTIRELLNRTSLRFASPQFWQRCTTDNATWQATVSDRGYDEGSVPAAGTRLRFGGEILSVTGWAVPQLVRELPEPWRICGLRAGEALGLRHFGVDFKGATLADGPESAAILEVNSSPLVVGIHAAGYEEEALQALGRVLAALFAD